jgi:type IV pilus assembly protein PilE
MSDGEPATLRRDTMNRNEKGFTLMELMVVIVIVAILAAVAVPLYINYVKDAQRTEAKAAIGAIATAEQAYFLKMQSQNPGTPATYGSLEDLETQQLLDLRDAKAKWTFVVTGTTTGYDVHATYTGSDPAIEVFYYYTQGSGGHFSDTAEV